MNNSLRCDIFCTVIDNFGDAAVCWRLASQLAHEFDWQVRLWIDDLSRLVLLAPDFERGPVDIRRWERDFPDIAPANIVIEAFACELPQNYIAAMATCPQKQVWLNLEYLSAEDWISGCHGLPSRHPHLPLVKYFFFPGFSAGTGGLLRERDYAARHAAFDNNTFRREFSLGEAQPELQTISLFSYANPALPALIDAWRQSATPVQLLQPGSSEPRQQLGALELVPIPFLPQQRYDELLWSCDLNFVRGEDSFVRAQWAGKPFVWQIYPQPENAHKKKLDAFVGRYGEATMTDSATIASMSAFWHAWNGHGTPDWPTFARTLPALRQHARTWSNKLSAQPDLATNLVQFCLERLK